MNGRSRLLLHAEFRRTGFRWPGTWLGTVTLAACLLVGPVRAPAAEDCSGSCDAEMLSHGRELEAFVRDTWRAAARCARRGPLCPEPCSLPESDAGAAIGTPCAELVFCEVETALEEALGEGWSAQGACVREPARGCRKLRAISAMRVVRAKLRRRRTGTSERFGRHQHRCVRAARNTDDCETEDICFRAARWIDGVLPCADAVDTDRDGAGGFPDDPDCESPVDPDEAPAIVFTDVTATAFPGAFEANPPVLGAGIAIGDVDGDGFVDLYLGYSGGRLFRNLGDGTFEEISEAAGIDRAPTHGAALGDIDNDGDLDLVDTALFGEQRHFLHINDGTGSFREEGFERGIATMVGGERNGRGASFADFDNDGYLDLYIVERSEAHLNPEALGPFGRLFRNRGAEAPGYFDDVTIPAGVVMDDVQGRLEGTLTFLTRFADLDGDGLQDLVVIADFLESRLFWNNGDGTFLDGTVAAGVGTDDNGMGAATEDFDGDGLLDLFVTSIFHADNPFATGNKLFRNLGDRRFVEVATDAGVVDGGWGWGTELVDYDNDGDPDLASANGQIEPGNDFVNMLYGNDHFRFWENRGGSQFAEISTSLGLDPYSGLTFGLLATDYDRDGDVDLFIGYQDVRPPVLLRNDGGNRNDWIDVRLRGTSSQRDGVGARVTVTPLAGGASIIREMSASATSPSSQRADRSLHFGLGIPTDRPVHEVEVFWPASGQTSVVQDLDRNRTHLIVEP